MLAQLLCLCQFDLLFHVNKARATCMLLKYVVWALMNEHKNEHKNGAHERLYLIRKFIIPFVLAVVVGSLYSMAFMMG